MKNRFLVTANRCRFARRFWEPRRRRRTIVSVRDRRVISRRYNGTRPVSRIRLRLVAVDRRPPPRDRETATIKSHDVFLHSRDDRDAVRDGDHRAGVGRRLTRFPVLRHAVPEDHNHTVAGVGQRRCPAAGGRGRSSGPLAVPAVGGRRRPNREYCAAATRMAVRRERLTSAVFFSLLTASAVLGLRGPLRPSVRRTVVSGSGHGLGAHQARTDRHVL